MYLHQCEFFKFMILEIFPTKPVQSHLSDLLPSKTETQPLDLFKYINEFYFLLIATKNTTQALKAKHFHYFDPLVGNNFCQGPAFKIAVAASRCRISLTQKEGDVEQALKRINAFASAKKQKGVKTSPHGISAEEFDLPLSEEELFFVSSYLLTVAKVMKSAEDNTLFLIEKIEPNLLKKIAPVTTIFSKRLVNHLRSRLATASVDLVRDLAVFLNDEKAIQYLSKAHTIIHNNRLECPIFFTATQVIFKSALQFKVPIVLWARQILNDKPVRELCLYYKPGDTGYTEVKPGLKDLGKAAIVIQCSASKASYTPKKQVWRSHLIKHDLLNLVWASSANHRQYPDPTKSSPIANDSEYLFYKDKAHGWGCSPENPTTFFRHIFCDKLENLAPLKYVLNNHLIQYHEFYREQFVEDLKSCFKNDHTIEFAHAGSKLSVKAYTKEAEVRLTNKIHFKYFFMVTPKLTLNMEEKKFEIESEISDTYHFYCDLLKIAKASRDPSKFLLDHKAYWSFRGAKIIKYLVANPKSFENNEMIENLIEVLKENEHDFKAQKGAIIGLGQALKNPELKQKAKEYLLEFAVLHDKSYLRVEDLRRCALQQLHSLRGEADVEKVFQEIFDREPTISLKLEAAKNIKVYNDQQKQFEYELVKRLVHKALDLLDTNKNVLLFDYVLWNNYPYSFQVIEELGELNFVTHVIRQYEKNNFWGAYSILKFMGMYTNDKKIFSKIVFSLTRMSKEYSLAEVVKLPYKLSEVESLSKVLAALRQNSAGKFYRFAASYIKNQDLNMPVRHISAFAAMPRGAEMRAAEKLRVMELESMMISNTSDKNFKILAIQSCLPYLVYVPESGWPDSMHAVLKQRNQNLANLLIPTLKVLATAEYIDIEVKREAKLVLELAGVMF